MSGKFKKRLLAVFAKIAVICLVFNFVLIPLTNASFTDQDSISGNRVSSGWWADQSPPESEITSLDSSYSALNFEIGYFADDPNTSGVKQVKLYYRHTFNQDWQFFGVDVPDINGDGSFEFTSPLGDGVYDFKTEAEDNAGNKESKSSPDDSTQVDTKKPITMLSLGEFGPGRFANQEILANGNFEDTGDPKRGWTGGGDGDHQVVSDPAIVKGSNSFLIGFKNTDLGTLLDLPAQDFLFQDINLPAAGSATLSFWYRLNTEDILNYDWFHALVLNPLTNSPLAQIAHDGLDFFGGGITDLGWKEVTHSLTDFLGQQIRLYFEVENTGDKNFQTWAYIDDVRITKGENNIDPATEISLEANDASGSGVLTTEYKVDGGGWQEYTAPFPLTGGEHELSYRSTDFNDLVEDEKTIPLVVSPNANFLGVVLNQISPRPLGTDTGSSGVPLDGEWIELWNNGVNPVDVNGWVLYDADNHTLVISVSNSDNDGNISDTGETSIPASGSLRVYRNGNSNFTLHDDGDTVELYTDYKISGGVLIDSFSYGAVAVDDKTWKRIPNGTGTWADPGEEAEEESLPEVDFDFREDKKAVWFEVIGVSSFDSLKYEISYNSDGGERGIVGEVEINGQEEIERRDLILGTCSSLGKVCVYDQGISKVQLKIMLIKKDEDYFEIEKEILY